MNKYIMILPILALTGCFPVSAQEPDACSEAGVQETARSIAISLLEPMAQGMGDNLAFFNNFQPVNLQMNAGPLIAIFDKGQYNEQTKTRYCRAKMRINVTTGDLARDKEIYVAADMMARLNGEGEGIIPLVFTGLEREIDYSVSYTPDGNWIEVTLPE